MKPERAKRVEQLLSKLQDQPTSFNLPMIVAESLKAEALFEVASAIRALTASLDKR